jgi:hypothetical protein
MLADRSEISAPAGSLRSDIYVPAEWLTTLISFIVNSLPQWRDDPRRPWEGAEPRLTAQLCSFLNSTTRLTPGWDFLQFKREEPDETARQRSIDLVAAPSGAVIWIEGREYSEYRTLLPIECKRLPTPSGSRRDAREYLYSEHDTTGGVQRFKAGHHGAMHRRAAMIGYLQERDILFWRDQLNHWITEFQTSELPGWTDDDRLHLSAHDSDRRIATLQSRHARAGLNPILLDHLWIEFSEAAERGA